jgi:hypothetical protein
MIKYSNRFLTPFPTFPLRLRVAASAEQGSGEGVKKVRIISPLGEIRKGVSLALMLRNILVKKDKKQTNEKEIINNCRYSCSRFNSIADIQALCKKRS